MPVYKAKNGTWHTQVWYTTRCGDKKHKVKRGFTTKKEALAWESDFRASKAGSMDVTFVEFCKLYEEDIRPRLKENTWMNKSYMIQDKLIPFFGKKPMCDITSLDIVKWQNELVGYRDEKGKPFKPTYLRAINNQLNAIINHAVRYYGLRINPVVKTTKMGSKSSDEMQFWTKEEYLAYSDTMMSKPASFYMFEILYWCGLRVGELLALYPEDFDFKKGVLSITKSYQRINGRDVITGPKTPKSIRIITMPEFLIEELEEYFAGRQDLVEGERVFTHTKYYLGHEMRRGCKETGVKRIRIHDLRHSHVSLLIEMGFSVLAIAERMGHESIDITYRYAHLFPSVQSDIASSLNDVRGE